MTTRQDAWTEEEDLLLAEVVLRHIREGYTQLAAFKEAGKLLSRTSAACGFRWNSCVRKLQKENIEEAKKHRKSTGKQNAIPKSEGQVSHQEQVTIEEMINLLKSMKNSNINYFQLHQEYQQLQKEKEYLEQRLAKVEEEYFAVLDFVDKKRSKSVDGSRGFSGAKLEKLQQRQ